uniref:Uncharacterized protein n=2 Tax=Kalmanozyma brasiliensis (strain GHG001) TaxID=1365824 RepID=V5EW65_KALBG
MPGPSSSSNAKGATRGEGDADLTDEDVGFKARDRKKAKVTKAITVEDDDDDAAASDHDDGIMTPPQLTSPRRSSRKGAPSPKKQQLEETTKSKKGKGKGKGQPSKTFDLEGDIEDNEAEEVEAPTGRSSRKDAASRKPTRAGKAASPVAEESEAEKEEEAEEVKAEAEKGAVKEQLTELSPSSEPSASSSKPADTPATPSASSSVSAPARATPTTVAIKRIDPSTPSSRLSSPSTSGPSSFYGKSLTKILTSSAARRPGLTRKTNIPSLLNHRGAPKPPAPKLAVSKRRMQDDDYEYDAEYEALIAKKEKGSDDESDEEEKEDGGAEEVEVEEQYD